MSSAKCIMVQGTMSGAGKSLLCAALCRIFAQDGYKTAPFKSQNMALNSFVTRDGLEMGRAQVVQAQAAGVEPDVRMNPILLKPSSDIGSQVIVNGEVRGNMPAKEYFRHKRALIPDILQAYNSLAEEFDIIVIEGAGSPAEINLKVDDIVNMGLAKLVDAPVLLAGDIDRGGVFAQLYGTVELLEPEERARIQGLVINKFRGDKTILDPGDEVITFSPYFGEYRNYVANYGGILVEVPPTDNFIPEAESFAAAFSEKTKAVIINNPNNPTGVVYSEDTIKEIASVLCAKEKEYGKAIYLLADEPYRELVYDGAEVCYLTKYYKDTIVGYSYSKSLSLPGERIGYLVMPDEIDDFENVVAAATVANRILGFVNAPSLIQRAVAKCVDSEVDVEAYNKNRELLYGSLLEMGYECIKPQGAFYLFVKALGGDDKAFCAKAKEFNLLLVPGSTFGGPGYVRIAYCVDYDMIKRSLPAFEKLAACYR